MASFGTRMRAYRERLGLSQEELASRVRVSRGAISMYECDKREPGLDIESRIADVLEVDLDALHGRENTDAKIPIYGYVRAGIPSEMITEILDDEEIPSAMARCGEYFGLRIKGRSMEPVFVEGDNIIVRKQPDVDSGDIAIVAVNGDDATVKVVKKTATGIMLIPKNPDFEPLFYTYEEIKSIPVTILGKVVELRRKL